MIRIVTRRRYLPCEAADDKYMGLIVKALLKQFDR
jgi:hypothetical protein